MAYAYTTSYPGNPPYIFEPPPSAGVHHPFSSPRFSTYAGGPSPRESSKHARHASHFESAYPYSARVPPQYSAYASRHTTMPQSTPLRNNENVSGFDYTWAKSWRPRNKYYY